MIIIKTYMVIYKGKAYIAKDVIGLSVSAKYIGMHNNHDWWLGDDNIIYVTY